MSTTATPTPDLKSKLDEVNGQVEEQTTVVKTKHVAWEQAREEFVKAGNDANSTDSEEFKKVEAVHREYATEAEKLGDLEGVRNGIFKMLGTAAPKEGEQPVVEREEQPERKSLGERSIESKEYEELKNSGVLSSDHRAFSAFLGKGDEAELKALLTGADSASGGSFVVTDRQAYVPQPQRPLQVLDLVSTGQTTSDTVDYVRQDAYTGVSAETAEAADITTGTKPEAAIAFTVVTETVKTIAAWVPATRRALADAGQLRTIIDQQLSYDVRLRLETQVVNGNGTGENIRGIINTSGILSQAKGSDSVSDAIHKAITKIRLGYVEPNGIALHPNDWEVVRLSRDDSGAAAGTGGYLYGPPSQAGAQQMWGLPVAVSASIPDDTGVVGDFRRAQLWLREGLQVLASDSHSDFFVKNLIAVLAEMRAAFGVLFPAAFCKVTSLD